MYVMTLTKRAFSLLKKKRKKKETVGTLLLWIQGLTPVTDTSVKTVLEQG